MSVKWIKDVDSGELFPIVDEEEDFKIPEHLQVSEHTVVDYEETIKNTIAELQEQLSAAQYQIDVYKNTQAVELSEAVHEQGTLTEKPKHFAIDKSWILLIVLCIVAISVCFLGFKYFSDNGHFVSSEQPFEQQEVVSDDEGTEESNEAFDMIRVTMIMFVSVGGVRIAINILKGTLERL